MTKYLSQAIGLALIFFVTAIAIGEPLAFINIPSIVIVVGLTVGGLLYSRANFRSASFWQQARQYAIGSGVVGFIIGLILILKNMDDPAAVGPAAAIALLTVLYGTFFGYFIALPNEKRITEGA
tara:strand:+ start:118 stop:489 length:372 start_codon:yes stop_codon:yes gene_type:complete